ncbi:hypothetical protein C7445_1279 [Alicyclobacillus sacchari]|uniref:Uncharacterized protein n=1 Tax=Alicyclobacillus sacchari TaxID=392010 RepID=A0A4R8L8A6_9BACL|nr:hypothetical protein C7445_1279 [Alicyclobacillus sacchari]GMA58084.1 hypothetical protein GCM10025858_25870 [Alicyclobacillus sacchari]
MNREINVILTTFDGQDTLLFEADPEIRVNLNSESGQQDLKTVFSKLLEMSLSDDIALSLSIPEEYTVESSMLCKKGWHI